MKKQKRLSGLLLAIALCSLISTPVIVWSQHAQHGGQSSTPGIGAAASNFELKSLDGKSIGLTTFRGKPLMINFFASWCDPCREEMPLINDLAAQASKNGYAVLGIAVEDTRAGVIQYAQEAKLVFPIALDLNSTVKRAYRIFGPPATFFIDGRGTIRDVVTGPITVERPGRAEESRRDSIPMRLDLASLRRFPPIGIVA
jgi:cytochrome c biogenesis protein CcmG/thiol:disulfide interchange protein DsbE